MSKDIDAVFGKVRTLLESAGVEDYAVFVAHQDNVYYTYDIKAVEFCEIVGELTKQVEEECAKLEAPTIH